MNAVRALAVAAVVAACSSNSAAPPLAPDAGLDAGLVDAGPTWSTPVLIEGNADGGAGLDLTAVVDPSGHVAAAYFTQTAPARYTVTLAREDGTGNWTTEAVPITSATSDLDSLPQLTGHYGIALAFDPTGAPALALLAGGNADNKTGGDGRWTSFDGDAMGDPLPSDAVIMQKGVSGWSTIVVAKYSNDIVATGFAVDDKGVVTGLWAALGFDSAGNIHSAFRDIHYGSDMSATGVSNLEYWQGSPAGTKLTGELIGGGRGDPMMLAGAGTYTKMLMVNDEPAVSFALDPDSTDGVQEVWFARRLGTSTQYDAGTDGADGGLNWAEVMVSQANGSVGQGPSLAYSPDAGFAIAMYDADEQDLVVSSSPDGTTWTPNTLDALGDTGQYPAAAFDAQGNLGVLYAFCRAPTDPTGSCSPSQELRFRLGAGDAEHIANVVPEASALVVDGSGRFVALYRDPDGGLYFSVRTP